MATVKTLLGYVKGPKGDTGETGATGATGAAATITVGSTTTVAAGLPARVTNVGTSGAAELNFEIPQGQPGSVGEISGYPVNAITSQAGDFPVPAVGDTIATLAGKQAKATQDAQTAVNKAYKYDDTTETSVDDADYIPFYDVSAGAAKKVLASNMSAGAAVLSDLATVESGASASKAYAVGDYLVKDKLLYKVIAAISQGNALTVGGNIQQTDVGAELSSLNADLANWVEVATLTPNTSIVSAGTLKLYENKALKKVKIEGALTTKAIAIGNYSLNGNVPTTHLPKNTVSECNPAYSADGSSLSALVVIAKNNVNGHLALGTMWQIANGSQLHVAIEWDY